MTRSLSFVHSRLRVSDLLEQHFDTAFAAPGGIARLRELILTLAMQGKLVEQDPNDPPASELLKEIEKEKASHEGTKTRRKEKLPPVKPEEVPYELPKGWEWVRLGDITDYNGRNNISGDEITPNTWLLDLEDIEKGTSRLLYRATFSERQSKSTKSTFQKGDVLYGKLRPYLDKVIVADSDGVCTTEIVPIVPFHGLNAEFLRWLLKRPAFLAHVNSLIYGVKMPRLGTDDAVMSVHPLPPFPEQHRIVARIDQLMVRCDALEKLRKERAEKRLAVHAAAIKQLLDPSLCAFAPSREENLSTLRAFVPSCDPFAFLDQHFGELYTVKENVAELRKAILQLAVMGRLVPQDPNDPPARELLKEIEKEKASHEGTKTRRKEKLPPVKSEEVPYQLPQGWEWVRFGEITINRDGERVPISKEDREKIKGEYDYYGASGVIDKVNDFIFDKSLLLIGEDGANLINRSTPIAFFAHGKYWVNNHAHVIDAHDYILLLWLEKYINAIDLKPYVTGSAQPKMNQAKMNSIAVALPPLPEQHRIVACIDQLMALCDILDQQIDAATGKQSELLDAVMALV
ncbi:type I restriction enzyme, S subunit [Nitrosomonas nitrosa]|uniref:Type I restriction enzyme, S subunit n=1 Tax=Nitrosomonas nitrosa TaxID=52442 RepID=A0A1I4S159_9PROT|nr:restriction endonuclease subunit S [Nitrosomonas nitrosa]SFM58276.1 type I restriction enzyme, S subunit [Nitrosomonas nitrosa]